MARITRTQKYAELRNQLEHGPETEIKSKELEKYEDRMENLNIEKPEVTDEIENVVSLNDLSKILEEEPSSTEEPSVEDVDAAEENTAVEVEENDLDDVYVPFDFDEIEKTVSSDTVVETAEEEILETAETVKDDEVNDDSAETGETEADIPSPSETDQETETIEVEDIDDNYLEECLSEVNEYNKSKGLLTAEEVPLVIANELRNVKVNEDAEDDEISNTVTMEIKKILSELDASSVENKDTVEAVSEIEDRNEEPKTEAQAQSEELPEDVADLLRSYLEPEKDEKAEDEESLGNTVVAPSVEEVAKAADELSSDDTTQSTKQATLLNETVPLEVTRSYEKEDDDDLDVEPGPNRILNIILIALIVILVLILAFVGYLILVAQGII